MDKKKLDTANILQQKIVELDEIIKIFEKERKIKITLYGFSPFDNSPYLGLEKSRKEEVINLLKKWRDEYKKKFEEL